nr:sulfurtransferase [Aquabacterium sp.]
MPLPFLNIASYRFVPQADLPALRQRLFDTAQAQGVRGTVLLAEEGINLCLAGPPEGIAAWLAAARTQPGLDSLPTKDSWSATQPFARLKVKIKREIIRMDMPADMAAVAPASGRAPAVSAATLAR